jgi:o-succinylbenzoate synthase
MKIAGVELRRLLMPLAAPFRTSFGTQTERDVLLVRVDGADGESGWGECVAPSAPIYSSEFADGAQHVIREFLLPPLFAAGDVTAARLAAATARIVGHRMAKAALEMALLDAELRARGEPLATYLGGVHDRVACGVSVGITDTVAELIEVVQGHVDDGYRRIKLKIEPGWDVEPVAAVRERLGDALMLQVDANGAYRPGDIPDLVRLDAFDLLLVEQAFPEEHVRAHADLARRIRTPVCLDESITSAQAAADAIALGACDVVNVKAGRVGGYLEARRVHDVCEAAGVPVWCGGMLETGLGRAANLALASLPNFTLPGDISASDRYYTRDITAPFRLGPDGTMPVPTGPGLGVEPSPDVLEEVTTTVDHVRP